MVAMEGKGDASVTPVRTSDRLRKHPKYYARGYMYYKPAMRKKVKSKKRTAASQIAKKLLRKPPARAPPADSIAANLRRSTRKRRISVNLEGYDTDSSSMEDDDLMRPRYRSSRSKGENNAGYDKVSARPKRQKLSNSIPRREGLRPRRSLRGQRLHPYQESEDDQESSEEQGAEDQIENGDDIEEDVGDEEEVDGGDEAEADGDDEDGEEEQEGRRRYDLRDRSEVRRPSPQKEGKHRPQSPRRVLVHGIGPKNSRYLKKGGSRMHKRPRFSLPDDSDDSLLVDESDEGPSMTWMRGGRGGMPWLLGGLDMYSPAAWGLNAGASGWGHQGDSSSLMPGVQTAGPSSKGGADIQPLQVDESVSFNDIGGLSEYIDALKEMVFFPLLYPDFFANYHITPPRGVLLCGPPGTGKTLIARALACAASKAGQKVSFYMRKGADVLSKWVGEAERQLKLLFEEAQKNQPSIIFFDEIDGLAPVRSSKQEQIHNSIVSTLLALMDGLDSRGQVVLIGATNRIDAIDGALRRPGRFDREFYFPLPGYEARAEILDIHTRKWKDPPPKELKMELAASCVGYCGADLKALCTEAAIRAFREKYPQVYTSDDKFVIDVDSVRVEKYHFLEAMSTITPAAHRGSIVHSRPLSSVIAPCLKRHLEKIMERIADIFPFLSSVDVSKFSALSYGSSIPLVYRPCLLICGGEGVGLDHVGPAVLHELEKFSVHSLGLPSLLSDPSAKTPEEALVHIFGEAKRTTPSILYLPQFHLWWDTAHELLRAVLLTLLNELPSNLPVLLLGTSSVAFTDLEEECASIFSSRNVYQVDQPSYDDRLRYFNILFESLLSLQMEESRSKSKKQKSAIDLPKAPKEVEGPKVSELKAKAEAEQHAVRRMRMCLRDICNRILYNKRFGVFHFPVSEEEVPDYRSVVHNPMDMATVLQRVDSGQYLTRAAFMKDIDLIVSNAKTYNGEDYNGSRIVSRACELRDVVHGMLSQMDPSLVSFCDKIASQGGPLQVVDDEDSSILQAAPVAQLVSGTRMSARLRNVQPEVNLSQSYEVLKRQKKSTENEQGMTKDETARDERSTEDVDLSKPTSPEEAPKEPDSNGTLKETDNSSAEATPEVPAAAPDPMETDNGEVATMTAGDDLLGQLETVKQRFMELTAGYGVPQLERLYSRMMKGAIELTSKENNEDHRRLVVRYLLTFVENSDNFSQAETSRQMFLSDSFDACFTSPLARSRRTAEIIWEGRDDDLIPDSDLREIDLYSFQGLLKYEGKERYGVLFQQWQKNAANFSIDGHYPVQELWDRAQNCWERILAHEGKSVLVVAHNAVNQALVATSLGLGAEYFRILLQSNCGASVLDFTPQTGGGPPNVCLNRLNQTPNSPVAVGSSAGRKTNMRIILACQGATQNSPEISLGGMGYAPLNMLGIIQSQKTAELLLDLKVNGILCSPQVAAVDTATAICEVQEAADCLGADCMPRYVEMKNLLELEIDDSFQTKQKGFGEIVQSGWMGSMEYKTLERLWAQSKDAWQALLNELPDDGTSDRVLVAVGHPAIHIALICRCLDLPMEYMSFFHLDDGSISVIDFPDGPKGRGVVRCTNYTAHLGRWSIPITRPTENDEEF